MSKFSYYTECADKLGYENKNDKHLLAHVQRLSKKRKYFFHYYKCTHCDKYHVGKDRTLPKKANFNIRLEGLLKSKNTDYTIVTGNSSVKYKFYNCEVVYDFRQARLNTPNHSFESENGDTIIKHIMRLL